eukprot:SM000090S24331  [mRNA]  locus=s90:353767:356154:+ [translate_table: standard]
MRRLVPGGRRALLLGSVVTNGARASGAAPRAAHLPGPAAVAPAWRRGSSAEARSAAEVGTGSEDGADASFDELYKEVQQSLERRVAPKRTVVHGMVRRSGTAEQVALALEALRKLRVENAVQRRQLINYKPWIVADMVNACLQAGVPDKAIVALKRRNEYGFTPTATSARIILERVAEDGNTKLLSRTLQEMTRSRITPTSAVADMVLRLLSGKGKLSEALALAKGCTLHKIALDKATCTALIQACEAAGLSEDAKWLQELVMAMPAQSPDNA